MREVLGQRREPVPSISAHDAIFVSRDFSPVAAPPCPIMSRPFKNSVPDKFREDLEMSIVKDFSARCKGIVQEAVKWAPHATRSHLQDYIRRFQSSKPGTHSDFEVVNDFVSEFLNLTTAGSYVRSPYISSLDKKNRKKTTGACLFSTITTRSWYAGEVAGMLKLVRANNSLLDEYPSQDEALEMVTQRLLIELANACRDQDYTEYSSTIWRSTALLVNVPGI
ncbi:hypothetical protein QAD02_007863 [Eretmocerus hayati]|uniref:Uncharacterized protein n=1 Tax=Eretmocerus hayati TaxID=131215 RepID=A0ACC2N545_9HYME|nr:hypothetical protein QAD02_007863 [Eretmocerus hayati]